MKATMEVCLVRRQVRSHELGRLSRCTKSRASRARKKVRVLGLCVAALFLLGHGGPHGGPTTQMVMAQEEALRVAFSGAEVVDRRAVLLDEVQAREAETLGGGPLPSRLATLFTATSSAEPLGVGVFDSAADASFELAVLVAFHPDLRVRSVVVARYDGPTKYVPEAAWLSGLEGSDARTPNGGDDTPVQRAIRVLVRRSFGVCRAALRSGPTALDAPTSGETN